MNRICLTTNDTIELLFWLEISCNKSDKHIQRHQRQHLQLIFDMHKLHKNS